MLIKTGSILDKDYVDWIETTLNKNSHIATEVPTDSKVIIWHGDNASDQIGLRFVAFLLQIELPPLLNEVKVGVVQE